MLIDLSACFRQTVYRKMFENFHILHMTAGVQRFTPTAWRTDADMWMLLTKGAKRFEGSPESDLDWFALVTCRTGSVSNSSHKSGLELWLTLSGCCLASIFKNIVDCKKFRSENVPEDSTSKNNLEKQKLCRPPSWLSSKCFHLYHYLSAHVFTGPGECHFPPGSEFTITRVPLSPLNHDRRRVDFHFMSMFEFSDL